MTHPSGEKATAYLGLGGNLGDPRAAMAAALRALDAGEDISVVAVSSIYRTPPWGKTDQPDFLNAVAEVSTTLSPRLLLDRCLDAERELKRVRNERWGPRLIDSTFCGSMAGKLRKAISKFRIRAMLDRAFVLVPMAEIAPDLVLGGETADSRARSIDRSGIVRLEVESDVVAKRIAGGATPPIRSGGSRSQHDAFALSPPEAALIQKFLLIRCRHAAEDFIAVRKAAKSRDDIAVTTRVVDEIAP